MENNQNKTVENSLESKMLNYPPGTFNLMDLVDAGIIELSDIEYVVEGDDDGGYEVTMYCSKLDYLNEGLEQPKPYVSQDFFLYDNDCDLLPF